MATEAPIIVKIVRRRITRPQKTSRGVKSMVFVTYSSRSLAPEVVRYYLEDYSLELERKQITERIKDRLGITDQELEIIFPEES